MKKWMKNLVILSISLCFSLTILVVDKVKANQFNENEDSVNCIYNVGQTSVTYYYNKTTKEFKETKGAAAFTEIETDVIQSIFTNEQNKLYCPTLYYKLTNEPQLTVYNITHLPENGYTHLEPSSNSQVNNVENKNNDVIKTCVYGNIEYVLNITQKKIESVNVPNYQVNYGQTYDQIYDSKTGCQCISISIVSTTIGGNFMTINNGSGSSKTGADANLSTSQVVSESDKSNTNNTNNNQNSNSNFKNQYIGNTTCGGITSFTFHERVPKLTSTVYNLLKLAVPIILVIMGMIDMFKAMSAGKEDEIKKAQKKFINRLIAGICAFLVFILVETVIGWISTATGNENAMDCVNCFINGPEHCETLE